MCIKTVVERLLSLPLAIYETSDTVLNSTAKNNCTSAEVQKFQQINVYIIPNAHSVQIIIIRKKPMAQHCKLVGG